MKLKLNELLHGLKNELMQAKTYAHEHDTGLFVIDEIEVEVSVEHTAEGSGKLDFEVVEFGGSLSRKKGTTIKLKLKEYMPSKIHAADQQLVLLAGRAAPAASRSSPFGTGKPVPKRKKRQN